MSNILKGLNESLSTLSPEQVEQFKKQLEIAKQGFDPNYQYSDDYSFWKKQNDKAQTISRLTKILNTAGVELQEEGVAEESDKQFAQRMKKKAAQPPTKGMSQKEKEDKGWAKPKEQGVAEGSLNEFAMSGGDDDEDPFDNYPCYDCGSTIFLHHTELCELAEENAIRDLPAKPGSQHWTGQIPKGLHPIPGLHEGVAESIAEDHSTATGGWGRGSYNTASKDTSRWTGDGHSDAVRENPEWYNDEANSMTTSQLKSLVKHAAKLRHAVKQMQAQGDTLEPWQQSKVTKAADYLDAVFNAVDDEHDMGESEDHPDEKEDKALIRKMVKQQALKQEDSYMEALSAKLGEKLKANDPVDKYINDFSKAAKTPNAKGHHQFKNKSPEKVRQMAIAASYGAKNKSKKK